jgi:hypothetical protein
MAKPEFELTGVREMQRNLHRAGKLFATAIEKALYRRAEAVMTKAKRDHVPVDTGNLRASGHVEPPERKGRDVSVTMAFGGPAAPYALAVHEHLSKHSPPSWQHADVEFSPAGRGPKYLERPLFEAMPGMARAIAEDLRVEKVLPDVGRQPVRVRDSRGRFVKT